MAVITRYPFVRHLRSNPTSWVAHVRNGRTIRTGAGAAFWYRPLSAVLSEVPLDDRELPLLFHARTADFQDLSVQATLTFRVTDPTVTTTRIDFSIDPATGRWTGTPLDQVAGLLTETAQQYVLAMIAAEPLTDVLAAGTTPVREALTIGLAADPRLADTGISIVGIRVVALRPEPEVERALQTPTREAVQQAADRATYERRAVAVERERAIGENELQTQIELARREEALVAQRGQNARREAAEQAGAQQVAVEAQAARTRLLAEAEADAARMHGEATAGAEAARMRAYTDVDPRVLFALATQLAAENLPAVENLVLTPDLLAPVLARLGRGEG